MQHTLLATKFFIPRARSELIPRPRLFEHLDGGLQRKLILISAPAGFGKTTLVSAWIERLAATASDRAPGVDAVAWLSLDERDADPQRFLAYLIEALIQARGDDDRFARRARGMLQAPQPPPAEVVLTSLINDLAATSRATLLVLDDYHAVEPSPVDDALAFLVDYMPPHLHLVLVTREDPQLPLARLRARGELAELRATELRFSREEVVEFLNRTMGLTLPAQEVAALELRTEGWIAGLHLAALSMQGHADPSGLVRSFTGSHRFVLDYLIEEILERQSPPIQTFLLQTAVLDRMAGALCDALTGRGDGQATLETLEHANLLIVPLDSERRWYRYHHLLIELLRQRLRQEHPEWLPLLHRRASDWHAQNGYADEAIEHALYAADFARAAHLIQEYADDVWQFGEQTRVRRWLDALPDSVTFATPNLCILHAGILYTGMQIDEADRVLRVAEAALAAGPAGPGKTAGHRKLCGRAAAVRAHLLSYQGDAGGAIDAAQRALDDLPASDATWRWSAFDSIGTVLSGKDDAAAYQARLQALEASKVGGNSYMVLLASLRLMLTLRDLGRLPQALELCAQQWMLVSENELSQTALAGWLHALWGELLAETDELDAALEQAERGVALIERGRDAILRGSGYLCLLRVFFSRGDLVRAETLLRALQRVPQQPELSPWITNQLAAWQARIWLAQGKLEAAAFWAETCQVDVAGALTSLHDFEYAVLARIFIAQGEVAQASNLLQRMGAAAKAGGRTSKLIEILLLRALAAKADGFTAPALALLEQALALAEPGGFVHTFVDEGPALACLLYQRLGRNHAVPYVQRLLAAFPAAPPQATGTDDTSLQIEALSQRELEVLRCIAEGQTNSEIAARLVLTLNTVKAHTRNIFGKLGVHNRTQAVAKARSLGLLATA